MTRLDAIFVFVAVSATAAACSAPAIRAIEHKREVACHENVRLLSAGLRAYMAEWDGYLPAPRRDDGGTWQDTLGLAHLRCPVTRDHERPTYGVAFSYLRYAAPSSSTIVPARSDRPAKTVLVGDGATR